MKKLMVVIGFLVASINIYPQQGWYVQYYAPSFHDTYQNSMFFIDSLTGWYSLQTYSGQSILKTTNGGNNWNIIDSIKHYITSIFFINQNTGWVSAGYPNVGNASDYGRIYKTTDNGLNWVTQVIPVYESGSPFNAREISCVKFLNVNTGYASGFIKYLSGQALLIDTYVLKTTNGGANWTVSLRIMTGDMVDDPPFFRKLDFVDENNVWVGGYKGIFYHTTNAGNNWTSTGVGLNIVDIKLINQNTGYVFSSYYWLYPNWSRILTKSTNGGFNFSTIYSTNTLKLNSFNFLDVNNGWICGDSNIIMKTTNGGINWITQYSPKFLNYKRIYFFNTRIGWITDDSGYFLKTTTAGTTFANNINEIVPDNFSLSQNYPNPFNPSTNIRYQITKNSFVTLKIYDILGKEIETLVNEKQNAGTYEATFDARGLTSGIYFYRLTAGDFSETKKMVLLK